MKLRIKQAIRSVICVCKGHKLASEKEFRCYIRDGRRFINHGRFFKCERCGIMLHIFGILSRELAALIETTLKDLPPLSLKEFSLSNLNYEFLNIYKKGAKRKCQK